MCDCEAVLALSSDADSGHPSRVEAADFDAIAKSVLELAKKNHLHIHEDENLAQLLAQLPVSQEIPEEAYQLVADLLLFLYQTDQKLAEKTSRK